MKQKNSILRNKGVQSLLASLLCIIIGLVIGYVKSKGYKVVPEAFRKSDMVYPSLQELNHAVL